MQDNHSRSRQGTLRGIHFQTHPGQGKLVRVARGRVLDVVVDLRRGSPTFGEWEGVELTDEGGEMLWIPVGFGHGFLVLSEVADFVYKCTNYYDPATEAGIRFDDPEVGIEWPSSVELLYSERDADGSDAGRRGRLAAVHGVKGRFAPSPTGVLHLGNLRTGAAGVAVRALGGLAVRGAGRGSRHGAGAAGAGGRSSWPTWPRSGSTGTGPCGCSPSAWRITKRALASLPVYECFCTRAEIRESASAAHGPVGRLSGDVPRGCRTPSAPRGGPRGACRRCGCGPARASSSSSDRVLGPQAGVVDDFVVRRNDGAFAYNLAVVVDDAAQGIEEVVRGADLLDSTPRQIWLARALGYPGAAPTRTCRWCSNAEGRRLAKRDGDVTLREVDAGEAVQWMAGSLGLRRGDGRSADGARRSALASARAACDSSRVRPDRASRTDDLDSDRDAPQRIVTLQTPARQRNRDIR